MRSQRFREFGNFRDFGERRWIISIRSRRLVEILNSRDCDGTLSLDRAHETIVIADAAAQIASSILFRNIAYPNELVFYVLHLFGDYCRPLAARHD